MKNLLLLNTLLILLAGIIWGCKKNEMPTVAEKNLMLKSGTICETFDNFKEIPLLTGQNMQVGKLIVSNNDEYLSVKFVSDEPFTLSEVHLWVGTCPDDVPANKKGIPIPGKFDYKASDRNCFMIELSDIYQNPEMLLGGDETIYIFAHAEVANNEPSEKESAWSAGESFGTKHWSTYSSYKCVAVGRGCFPNVAHCGSKIDGVFYYNNKKGGDQIIYVDNGEVAGTVRYETGKFYFNFSQSWSFTDLFPASEPIIEIFGYYEPGYISTLLFADEPPENPGGPYSVSVSPYPYFKLNLKIQYCY